MARNDKNDKNYTIENAQIAFRNFTGKEDMYNRAGDRNFSILLEEADAAKLLDLGWNVKHLKVREEGETPQPYIQVAISYKNRPPKICMVTSKNLTYLAEGDVEMLDWVDIETADVALNPYEWVVNGKTGVKAYVHSLFIKIEEDYLQDKWTTWVEEQKSIAGPVEMDWIEGETVERPLAIGR